MSNIMLIIALIIPAAIFAYAMFIKVRVARLQEDLLTFRDEAVAASLVADPGAAEEYRFVARNVAHRIKRSPSLNAWTFAYMIRLGREGKLSPASKLPHFKPEVEVLLHKISMREVNYVYSETLGGQLVDAWEFLKWMRQRQRIERQKIDGYEQKSILWSTCALP